MNHGSRMHCCLNNGCCMDCGLNNSCCVQYCFDDSVKGRLDDSGRVEGSLYEGGRLKSRLDNGSRMHNCGSMQNSLGLGDGDVDGWCSMDYSLHLRLQLGLDLSLDNRGERDGDGGEGFVFDDSSSVEHRFGLGRGSDGVNHGLDLAWKSFGHCNWVRSVHDRLCDDGQTNPDGTVSRIPFLHCFSAHC